MGTILDLTHKAWQRDVPRLGVTLIGTWIEINDRYRPCMAIIRTGQENNDHTIPCIITMDKAWIWSEEVGAPRAAAEIAYSHLQALRLDDGDPMTALRYAGMIHDHLNDLLTIPPYKPRDQVVVADITVTDRHTGKVKEVEMRDNV